MQHVDAEGFDWKITEALLEVSGPLVIVFEQKILTSGDLSLAKQKLADLGYVHWIQNQSLYAVKFK